MTEDRIQKIIAASGFCSRRHAEKLILEGRVKINNSIAILGDKATRTKDKIYVDNVIISKPSQDKVYLINKPPKIITSCYDPLGRATVLTLLPEKLRYGIYPVGRLDFNSRGALLLTNNGDLTLKLTHPRYAHEKTYLVWVKGQPTEENLNKWREGLSLDGEPTMAAYIKTLESSPKTSQLKVILKEGRNRQIRRIADLLGYPVLDLQRTAIAEISINGLAEGEWRELNKSEWLPFLKQSSSNQTTLKKYL